MTFNEKLKKLRKNKNITQEELAQKIFVTRTAVSKWESGRGYPSLDTLKILAEFYGISIDDLISNEEIIDISKKSIEKDKKQTINLWFSLLDIMALVLFFLPVFSLNMEGNIVSVGLFKSNCSMAEIIMYTMILSLSVVYGLISLISIIADRSFNIKYSVPISLVLNGLLVFLFLITRETYAGVVALVVLSLKIAFVLKK